MRTLVDLRPLACRGRRASASILPMRGCSRVLGISALVLLSVCAGACQRSTTRASAATTAGGETAKQAPDDGRREMTWEEYYVDVEQRARRAGGVVMWFNPPRLARRPAPAIPPGSTPTGGPPLSGPMPTR
jgi:hypothetical protein